MWLKFKKLLKNPLIIYRIWRFKRNKKVQNDVILDISYGSDNEESMFDENINIISERLEIETSLTLLENQIELLAKSKNELTNRERNKYNNQLDQLLKRANARLRKLQSLSFEELDLERILTEQKQLLLNKNKFIIINQPVDFSKIRDEEQLLSDLDLNKLNLYPAPNSPIIPKSLKEKFAELLASVSIKSSFADDEDEIEVEDDIEVIKKNHHFEKTTIDENEVEEIIEYLKSKGINHFHHVTNINNIDSIKEIGLYSWMKLDELGIKYHNNVADGLGKNLDVKKGKQNYIRLSFCKATPMFYAKRNLQTNVIYQISINCIRECKFEFSNMNATDKMVRMGSNLSFIKENLKFNLFNKNYQGLDVNDKKYYQAEILLKEHLPPNYIINKIPF